MNTYVVNYHNGTNWTPIAGDAVMPLNIGTFLDERLDECQIVVYNDTKKLYKPNTPFQIIVTIPQSGSASEVKTFYFKVASDKAEKYPIQQNKYKHSLGLIEATKYLEGVVCQTLTFTNIIPTAFASTPIKPSSSTHIFEEEDFESNLLKSPLKLGQLNTLPSAKELGEELAVYLYEHSASGASYECRHDNGVETTRAEWDNNTYLWASSPNITPTASVTIKYTIIIRVTSYGHSLDQKVELTYQIPAESTIPTQKWTIKTVCERIFQLAEPLTSSAYTPRFSLVGGEATDLDKIIAPEFTMSQSTLREQLQVVGGKIHGEPRVKSISFVNGEYRYKIGFDYYGRQSQSVLPDNYLIMTVSQAIDQYVTQIHTNPSNLVNSLQDVRGTITDPGAGSYRSLRSEQSNVRVTDSNGVIQTAYPIYSISKLMIGIYKYNSDSSVSTLLSPEDCTAYLFEATAYDSTLTDYTGRYPRSKKYAIRYKQGEKNITGLFYQCPNAVSQAFENYSIVNILSVVSGQTTSTIQGYLNEDGASIVSRIVYKPIFNSAFTHGKQEYSTDEPYTTVYNQSNGLVEMTYYGENVKGVAHRMGNPDIAITATYAKYSEIPNIGDSVDVGGEKYSVSAVNTELTSSQIKCTLALTKDFNRISQYVGIDSKKRIAQVSLDQSYDRDVIIKEYLVIGPKPNGYDAATKKIIGSGVIPYFGDLFSSPLTTRNAITQAVFSYKTQYNNDNPINKIVLPVVGSGEGNTTVLTASFKDNYSAGVNVNWLSTGSGIKGFWQEDVPYSDYYGRAKYVCFKMLHDIGTSTVTKKSAFEAPKAPSPQYYGVMPPIICDKDDGFGGLYKAYLARKDSRERFSTFNYCIEAKTTIDGLNIGSGISQMNALLLPSFSRPAGCAYAKLYLVPEVDEFPYKLDDSIVDYNWQNWKSISIDVYYGVDRTFYIGAQKEEEEEYVAAQGWVIAIPPKQVTQYVSKEDGAVTEQIYYTYGNIIMSKKESVPLSQTSLLGTDYTFRMEKK